SKPAPRPPTRRRPSSGPGPKRISPRPAGPSSSSSSSARMSWPTTPACSTSAAACWKPPSTTTRISWPSTTANLPSTPGCPPAGLASSRARVSQILTELSTLQGPTLLTILQDPAVQEDLGLDAGQKTQLARLAPRDFELLAKEYWESFTLDPKERRAKGLEAA